MSEQLLEVMASLTAKPVESIQELVIDGETKQLNIDKFSEFLKAELPNHFKAKYDDGFKEADRKVNTSVEENLKKYFGVESKKRGKELWAEVAEIVMSRKQLEEQDIVNHPKYKAVRAETEQAFRKELEERENKLKSIEQQYAKKDFEVFVTDLFNKKVDELKPVFSSDKQEYINKQKAIVLKSVLSNNFVEENGVKYLSNEAGEKLRNRKGTSDYSFDEFIADEIKDTWELQDQRKNTFIPKNAGEKTQAEIDSESIEIQQKIDLINDIFELQKIAQSSESPIERKLAAQRIISLATKKK